MTGVPALVRAHAATVDPWLREAAGWGVDAAAARAALTDLEPAVAALDGDPEVALPLVRATLDLLARGRWHAASVPRGVVLTVLPRLATWVRAWPADVVPAVLAASRGVARAGLLDAWVDRVARADVPAAPTDVRPALLVAAWRSGLVRYRDAALDAAAALPAATAAALLEVPEAEVGVVLERHRADRWWWPGRDDGPGVVQRVGGFVGWGGPWVQVPRVAAGGPTGWLVVVDGTVGAVVADVHGSAVVGLEDPPPTVAPPRPDARRLPVPWLDEVTGAVPGERPDVLLVARTHSCTLDVVRVAAA
ncbi:hypothetical protein Cfla_1445 [Cellulomonas flavigena DSM 20109]|uniref:Uncharacterized protein n=1 Tax=Cellulomonas flavigena (strain ATCC 482 / DSM 20109 / BCRC 11376 / JCM 18109 / NBRC 3775 / NCIMB 8073 / NRS 134) TaxID=446466 RepID=D5UD06_CELFN|nr:hypothetical protein Cfla_1445 [Cellulomonas flavigena DSM 20109]